MNKLFSLQSNISNIEFKADLLEAEALECLRSLLPPDETDIPVVFDDDAGNRIERMDKDTVYGEHTIYPVSDLTLRDRLRALNAIAEDMALTQHYQLTGI